MESGDRVRLSARVTWEACALPPADAWYETGRTHADGLVARPEAFVLPLLAPALLRGERRIVVEGSLCPSFLRNLAGGLQSLRGWYPDDSRLVLEATEGPRPLVASPVAVAATTFSGGVDSLAAVRVNRIDLPLDHPHALRDAYFVFGMNSHDFRGGAPDPDRWRDFEIRLARWRPIAQDAHLRVVPVASNLRTFAVDFPSWALRSIGAFLSAVAHAFSGRVARMLVPTVGGTNPLELEGCHPMLVPFWSSTAVAAVCDGSGMTRIDRLRLLTDWPAAMSILQSCQQHDVAAEHINCGRCNKCHRTMVALEALGRLEAAPTFPRRSIDADFVAGLVFANEFDAQCHAESATLLRASGRRELARALDRRIAAWRRRRRWKALRRRFARRRPGPAGGT